MLHYKEHEKDILPCKIRVMESAFVVIKSDCARYKHTNETYFLFGTVTKIGGQYGFWSSFSRWNW